MKREIIKTLDGSTTIHLQEWDECYHSKHGAIQEAKHVFIKNGLSLFEKNPVSILEIGFGTGLNAFITFLESKQKNQKIDYVGVEAYPVEANEVLEMNYVSELDALEFENIFEKMHKSDWDKKTEICDAFSLTKRKQFFHEIDDLEIFDLIYFDAFGYRVQPELWSTEIFQKMYNSLKPNGVLVTYAARGVVKRSMIEVGFTVEKLAGPPGKREMFRAFKKV
ncbi:tRNA (5-methylaminomethyl-2-thiouridine)(34)-methyltransferase MnmD [Flavobacterium hibernum]|uniref:SAM-dependent methyltransferase n=1 Tax=Flavobacterium hibernum TaxID=37752 RepID=A0A0D0F3V0_9FLAO|nr:tRNA (5-methylaminomethyl-2-thiouridine)(34)-methyltransferase MnmD [Flavobacterium hibernum]KIO54311.1 SAM-dependent methyltransferase [Flavobacterium hibernum]OXA88224.1 SAM-dependent methyltransferase [Flavobacterium hibernum]PTT12061.1 methyltransferase domain-containing protein [Flavobacterium sp. HMWF030]STO10851.1 tRNA 5-methylaminomethyl-2-thiouridine biosynthesis bifunctional protein MnmC [Flavobacterium hibernum]